MKCKERNHTGEKLRTNNIGEGPLISFSGIESFLGLFSQSGAFVSFVGTKESGDILRIHNLILDNQAGLKVLAC